MRNSMAAALLAVLCGLASSGAAADGAGAPIFVYYFSTPGCPHCGATDQIVRDIRQDPQVRVQVVDVHLREGLESASALLAVAGHGSLVLPAAPSLLIGETYLTASNLTPVSVAQTIARYRVSGAPDLSPGAERIRGRAAVAAAGAIRRWRLLPVMGAGLLDGVNPCAFATLVFLLSYLGARGLKGRALWKAGLLFAVGVFAAYYAFGCGLLGAALALDALPAVRQTLYAVAAAGCLVLAVLSFRDALALRAGTPRRVSLQLPDSLKRRAHTLIHRITSARLASIGAVVAGALVAVVELACTGQVYVPAIILLTGVSETRAVALAWLSLYCLCFVTPLLVLLVLVSCGSSAGRLATTAARRAPATKALMALFFVAAAGLFVERAYG